MSVPYEATVSRIAVALASMEERHQRDREKLIAALLAAAESVSRPPVEAPPKLAYRPETAAKMLDIGRTTLYSLMSSGELETIKIGRARLIPAAALDRFIERLREEGGATGHD
ncbi:MAG TPA: helix-turn-helix domain-containing protein [Micromonosporaceae bacterium]|nr:helix-turn-helix domain-containing protein [Micromonosporaceae bacterium]